MCLNDSKVTNGLAQWPWIDRVCAGVLLVLFTRAKSQNKPPSIPIKTVPIAVLRWTYGRRVGTVPEISVWRNTIDKRRQNRGNLALILESSWIIWRVSLAHANLFRSNPPNTNCLSFFGDWKAIGRPMHGLAESGWPECSRSGGAGGVWMQDFDFWCEFWRSTCLLCYSTANAYPHGITQWWRYFNVNAQ